MASSHLPFLVEYAKTGRASCKGCKTSIAKDSLRLAQVVQSPFHDGVMTKWFHENCFFTKARPKTIGDIENFDNIRWEDQEKIRAKIGGTDDLDSSTGTGSSGKKGRKREKGNAFLDFTVEYAKSNRSTCKACEEFGFFASGDELPGFKSLGDEDRQTVLKKLPKVKEANIPPASKKMKTEPEEKSGNEWVSREFSVKVPKMMYPIDIDDAEDDSKLENFESDINSNLKKPVQDLIRLIFDVEIMKKAMKKYELDTEKMPLEKLSKQQLQKAFSVLTELQVLVSQGESAERRQLITDASNRFYTLVPHFFGVAAPTILDNEVIIVKKSRMLDKLIGMEIAYNLLSVKTESGMNPLDAHYKQLNTDIDVLDRASEQFKLIEQYTKNTHAATHTQYELVIEDIFEIKKHGSEKKFRPFKKLPNRKLLWHGSKTTNFAGILSQGLRIASPEAPVTGYMFGKGIYFADMVSKSANYCGTSSQNPTGLLMLCEVALGNMYKRLQAEYVEKLPKGVHSTFGMGKTTPDPEKSVRLPDGLEVPCGPGISANLPDSPLKYNEYIVYNVDQVQAKYLVRMNFKYKY